MSSTRYLLLIGIVIFITFALLDCVSGRWIPEDSKTTNIETSSRRSDNYGLRHHRKNQRGLKQSVDLDAISYTTKRTVKKRNSNNKRRSGANKKTKKQQQRVARRAEIIPFMDDDERKLDHLLGLGVFGDMRKFFDELKTNLDVTEAASPSLEMNGKEENPEAQDDEDLMLPTYLALRTTPPGSEDWMDDRVDETATRTIKSPRLRGFVSMGPASSSFQKTHQYDPALLWTGLGRR